MLECRHRRTALVHHHLTNRDWVLLEKIRLNSNSDLHTFSAPTSPLLPTAVGFTGQYKGSPGRRPNSPGDHHNTRISRDDANHYKVKKWPDRVQHTVGKHNVKHQALVDPKKIYLPPLHIKLGLIKNFKAMDHNSDGFKYLKQKFGEVQRDAKLKAGIFDGPQVCELIRDKDLPSKHRPLELRAWESFVQVVHNFLGNHKATNYEELVDDMLISFKRMGCRMSLMIHFLHSHLDFFPPNLGDVSDEYGERFHQDISEMETRYQGHYNTNMMGDYCWFLQRETSVKHKRKSKCLSHF
ncbi:hypothetical protein MHYP_G00205330 [Metynnis hypsauchen]